MIDIKQGNYTDYLFLFGESRSHYVDLIVEQSANGIEKLFYMAYEDKRPVGYICGLKRSSSYQIAWLYTVEDRRCQGVAHTMVAWFVQQMKVNCYFNITEKHPGYDAVEKICGSLGFDKEASLVVYHSTDEKLGAWDDFMKEKGNKMVELLERWGFSAVSFAEASSGLLEQIYDSSNNSFHNHLNVQDYFDNKYMNLRRELSFVATKAGKLAAYCLVTSQDGICGIYEQFSESEQYIGSGVILLPFVKSMEVFRKNGYKRATFAIAKDNARSNTFREKVIDRIVVSHAETINFIYHGVKP